MKKQTLKKFLALAAILPVLAFSALSMPLPAAEAQVDADENACSSITLVSGDGTKTAGYTAVNPLGLPIATQPGTYSEGDLSQFASDTDPVIPPWVDPDTDPDLSGSDASWISTDASWPGGEDNEEGTAEDDQWRLFRHDFELPDDIEIVSADLYFSADNAAEVYLDGSSIATTGDVYEESPDTSAQNFAEVWHEEFSPHSGENTLDFVVRNWGSDAETNPTGLVYKAVIEYCPAVDEEPEDGNVTVTIVKFIDGEMATAESADEAGFPMSAEWDAENTGAGSGNFTLGPEGFNSEHAYTAVTTEMTAGADYSAEEILDTDVVSMTCEEDGTPFALAGYTTGDSLEDAMDNDMSTSTPELTDIQEDKTIIVWNTDCDNEGDDGSQDDGDMDGEVDGVALEVTNIEVLDGSATANDSFEDGWQYLFHITLPDDEPNVAMKFLNWMQEGGDDEIPVANNMRISSDEADNGGATILLTAEDTYSSPDLHMVTDLDAGTDGTQVQVLVEVKIPVGTDNGSYTTTWGVRSLED